MKLVRSIPLFCEFPPKKQRRDETTALYNASMHTAQEIIPMKYTFKLRLLGIALAWCLGAPSSLTPLASPAEAPPDIKVFEPIPFPDGVVDSAGKTAFVTSPKGGIQAVRLEDGKVLWSNDKCTAQPWLVAGDRLIARGDHIFVLDIKNDGKVLRESDAIAYPKVETPDRCTVNFQLWAPHVTGDTLETKWYAVANIDRSKGRPFNFEGWTGFNKSAPCGDVKVKLDSGRTELQSDPKAADISASLMPEEAKAEKQMPKGLPDKLVDVWKQYFKDQNGRITTLDGRLVGVSMTLEKNGQEYSKIVDLNTWDIKTGKAADPVNLAKDKALSIANILLTQDRHHAAVQFSTSVITIYSLADGKTVAKDIKGVSSPESAFVDGKRIYFTELSGNRGAETPNSLKAIDLETGKVAWEAPLKPRSTVPLPP
jgi:hypothetical protein